MKLSVIIPCFGGVDLLAGQLAALSRQRWSEPWEVIVADNGANEGLAELVARFARSVPGLRIVDATARKGRSFARNQGAQAAKGRSLAFCDADDEVGAGWVRAIGEALEEHEFVASRTDNKKLNVSERQLYLSGREDDGVRCLRFPPYLPFASTNGLGIRRALHERVGGFDETFVRAQDTEYCVRVQQTGASLHYAPRAVVHYRRRNHYGGAVVQGFPWAYYAVLIYKRYGVGQCRLRGGWRKVSARLLRLLAHPPLFRGESERMRWVWAVSWCVGLLAGGIRHRVEPPFQTAAPGVAEKVPGVVNARERGPFPSAKTALAASPLSPSERSRRGPAPRQPSAGG